MTIIKGLRIEISITYISRDELGSILLLNYEFRSYRPPACTLKATCLDENLGK